MSHHGDQGMSGLLLGYLKDEAFMLALHDGFSDEQAKAIAEAAQAAADKKACSFGKRRSAEVHLEGDG